MNGSTIALLVLVRVILCLHRHQQLQLFLVVSDRPLLALIKGPDYSHCPRSQHTLAVDLVIS